MISELNSTPAVRITGATLTKPSDICAVFRTRGIKDYIYRITCRGVVVKYGISNSTSSTATPGERVYRQIGHLDSWGDLTLTSSSGMDFINVNLAYKIVHGYDIDHRDIIITVWDLTNYKFKSINKRVELEKLETKMINKHIVVVGNKPIGNIKVGDYNEEKTVVAKDDFERNFTIV